MTTATGAPCGAVRKDGQPCAAWANASGFCIAHDPQRAAQMAAARRAGGRARHGRKLGAVGQGARVVIDGPRDVLTVIESEVNTLLGMEASISRARAVGYLLSVFVTTWESSELEKRVQALEAQNDHRQTS